MIRVQWKVAPSEEACTACWPVAVAKTLERREDVCHVSTATPVVPRQHGPPDSTARPITPAATRWPPCVPRHPPPQNRCAV